MSLIMRVRALLANKKILYAAVILVTVVGGWFVFFKNGVEVETFTVTRGEFLQQVSVSGTVVAAQNVDLGFSSSGRVSHVYAAVGDTVSRGAIIAEVENGDLRATLLQKQAALETQEAKLASLKSGTRPEEIAVTEAAVENDRVVLTQANQSVINAIQDAYAKSDDAIHNKVDQFLTGPRTSSPQFTFQVSDAQLANDALSARASAERILTDWQYESSSLTLDADIATAATHANSYLSTVSSLLTKMGAAVNRGITSSSVSQATIDGYAADVATGRTNVNTAISALNTALTTRANAIATLAKDEKTLALYQAGSTQDDINAQAAQVKAAQAEVDNARAQLGKTIVYAPFAGVITKMDAKVGEIVSANTSAISMISTGTFQVESYVPEVNIAQLEVGDPAELTLDAYGEREIFPAQIVSIDPAETVRDGVATYKTILEFLSQDSRVRSGMTANVVITTERKADVLSIPQGLIAHRNGKTFVSILRNETTLEQEVVVGSASSVGDVEIVSGLNEGDVVVVPQ